MRCVIDALTRKELPGSQGRSQCVSLVYCYDFAFSGGNKPKVSPEKLVLVSHLIRCMSTQYKSLVDLLVKSTQPFHLQTDMYHTLSSFILLTAMATLVASQITSTITVTTTTTITTTSTTSVKTNCAQTVNVTGACRRRRGFQIDEPQILTFDEDELDEIDHILYGMKPSPIA